jgi:hypothetical protein
MCALARCAWVPLAYAPETPPPTEHFPIQVDYAPNLQSTGEQARHHCFGTSVGQDAARLFAFWTQARERRVKRAYFSFGSLRVPVFVGARGCRAKLRPYHNSDSSLFMQHGSYQWLPLADQTHPVMRNLRKGQMIRLCSEYGTSILPYSGGCCQIRHSRSTIHDRTKPC